MVGRQLISWFIALPMGAVSWPNAAVACPNLPPAPYKPPAVATVFDSGWWKSEIVESKGMATVCADRGSEKGLTS